MKNIKHVTALAATGISMLTAGNAGAATITGWYTDNVVVGDTFSDVTPSRPEKASSMTATCRPQRAR